MTIEVYFQSLNDYLSEENQNLKNAKSNGLDHDNISLIEARIEKTK